MRTTKSLLTEGTARLEAAGVSEAALNCAWLLAHLLKTDRLSLLADGRVPVPAGVAADFETFLVRKAEGEPLAYILGSQPFCGLSLKVDRRVLVPRPETEELAGLAADFLLQARRDGAPAILDFGAGSGAIALVLARRFPGACVTAAEKSRGALACAEENARALALAGRMKFLRVASVADSGGPFDLIVSNPPYIPTGVIAGLDKEVLAEPRLALDGGADGLDIARAIIASAPAALKKGGALLLELGDTQGPAALELLDGKLWKGRRVIKDLNGKQRFVKAVKKG
ncbi:MAG: peptide chain release factor N(5)-glutamine methyltransferase [Elusimicrobiales bacterium]|jgi:release factor glutamine methyltransferase